MKTRKFGWSEVKDAVWAKFPPREIYLRSGGNVRFLTISTKAQVLSAAIGAGVIGAWAAAALVMVSSQVGIAAEQAALEAKGRIVASQAKEVKAYRRSVGDVAADLDRRQDMLDDLVRSHLGEKPSAAAVVGAEEKQAAKKDKISALSPSAAALKGVEQRQLRFAAMLTSSIEQRAKKAEAAIRSFGLNPAQIMRSRSAQGGPFIPWTEDREEVDPDIAKLATAFERLEALERGLVAIPSGKPTATPMLSSSYGYRRDPFNGHAAFHSGIDFPGAYGQPILAAARGRVVYVGQRQGYGNVVEVDHGNGLMTRYAHLSRFGTKVGANVMRGQAIARMGSTGRSTGTHLHFEVRLNGAAINPRRFLEAKQDVLQVQQIAKQRIADGRNWG